ncbi:hypothetical protein Tco_0528876 [Tanacetum coccineum]
MVRWWSGGGLAVVHGGSDGGLRFGWRLGSGSGHSNQQRMIWNDTWSFVIGRSEGIIAGSPRYHLQCQSLAIKALQEISLKVHIARSSHEMTNISLDLEL